MKKIVYKMMQVCSMLILASCENVDSKEQLIINGRWETDLCFEHLKITNNFDDALKDVYPRRRLGGFVNNGFQFSDNKVYLINSFHDSLTNLNLNSQFNYKIVKDSLIIFSNDTLFEHKLLIEKLTAKTIILRDLIDNVRYKYNKREKIIDYGFNKIIVIKISNNNVNELVFLDNDGNFFFKYFSIRDKVIKMNYFFNKRLNFIENRLLWDNFAYLNLNDLKSEYTSAVVGELTIYFTVFFKDDKIIRIVKDVDRVSPDPLQWGYLPIINLPQNLKIDELGKVVLKNDSVKSIIDESLKIVKQRLDWDWSMIYKNEAEN